jgi:hypothetical protein
MTADRLALRCGKSWGRKRGGATIRCVGCVSAVLARCKRQEGGWLGPSSVIIANQQVDSSTENPSLDHARLARAILITNLAAHLLSP